MFSDILSMNHTMKRNIEARTENTRPYATTNRPATSPLTRRESRNFGRDLLLGVHDTTVGLLMMREQHGTL